MGEGDAVAGKRIGALELLAIGGFAFFFAWMFLTFYWLPARFFQEVAAAQRDLSLLFVFIGALAGYLVAHAAGKVERFNPCAQGFLAALLVAALVQPAFLLALACGVDVPFAVSYPVHLLTGVVGALFTVCWLHAASLLKTNNLGRLVGLSLAGGGVLFVLVAFLPDTAQPIAIMLLICASGALIYYVLRSEKTEASDAQPANGEAKWRFTLEIVPSFVVFGVVFAMTFVFLFNYGVFDVFVGLASTIAGSGAIAVVSVVARDRFDITILQRVLLVTTVLACLVVPFAPLPVKIACSCLILASWAALMTSNYAMVVRKCINRGVPVFRGAPIRLVPAAVGFAVGWAASTVVTFVSVGGSSTELFTGLRLVMVFVLVLTVMVFPSEKRHHSTKTPLEDEPTPQVVATNLSETELFDRRCDAVAQLYQLSARETEILKFLARGRNAAYIQSKLTISPHTVKSHIYSIYRKTDIHSQQKLMDFVEEFPLEL